MCIRDRVYVGYDNGRVQAFDENTLESLWITDENKNAINSDFVFTNGKLYFGTTAKTTDWYDNGAPFSYYVVTTSDDDKTKPDEEKTMKKVVESKTGKFYLKKGVVLGKYIVISDTAGTLTMIDTTNDKVTDTKDIGEAFSGNITYDEMTGTIYFVAGTNDLYLSLIHISSCVRATFEMFTDKRIVLISDSMMAVSYTHLEDLTYNLFL